MKISFWLLIIRYKDCIYFSRVGNLLLNVLASFRQPSKRISIQCSKLVCNVLTDFLVFSPLISLEISKFAPAYLPQLIFLNFHSKNFSLCKKKFFLQFTLVHNFCVSRIATTIVYLFHTICLNGNNFTLPIEPELMYLTFTLVCF